MSAVQLREYMPVEEVRTKIPRIPTQCIMMKSVMDETKYIIKQYGVYRAGGRD